MSEIPTTMHRPADLVPPTDSLKTALKHTSETVDTVLEDSQTYLETVLAHPKAQKQLDHREQLFVAAYIAKPVAAQAALDAGYSKGVAQSKACKWVRCDLEKNPKLHVFAALHSNNQKIHNKAVKQSAAKLSTKIIDAQYVLDKSVEHLEKSSGDIPTHVTERVDPTTGTVTRVEHYDYNGGNVGKAIELVAKNKKVKAFSNELEINTDSSLGQLLTSITGQSGPPVIEGDIIDAEIVEDSHNTRPPALPEV